MNISEFLRNRLGVSNFDITDVQLYVAGHSLNDFTNINLTPDQNRRTEQGIDPTYHTYVTLPSYCTLTISFLPECPDMRFMEELQKALHELKGYFEVTLKYNKRFIGTYDCYFKMDSADSISSEASDKSYEMVAVRQYDNNLKQGFQELDELGSI